MRKIKVTGYMYLEPEDVDESPENTSGVPLTEEAFNMAMDTIGLDNLEFELVEDDD